MNYAAIARYVMDKPKHLYAIIWFMVIVSLAMLPNLTIDTDPENMLSQDDSARVFHNKVKQDFQMHDMIVVGMVANQSIYTPSNLSVIQQLSDYILTLEGVIQSDVLSLSVVDNITQQEPGTIRFEYLMKQAPSTQTGSDDIQQAVKNLPLLDNTLISGDSKAGAIYVPITDKNQSYAIAEQIRQFSQNLDGSLTQDINFHITGLPIAEDQFGFEMFVQMGIAAPMAGMAIFLLLWFFFRQFNLILAPMIVAMATVVIIMGSLIGAGFTVHIMSSMIAIFLMPIAVVDSVHILSEFADRYRKGDDAKQVISKVMEHLYTPMLYTSITSAVGFYSLLLTPIPPVKVFGFFIGTGILLAFALTVTFMPAYIARMKPQTLENLQQVLHRLEQKSLLSGFLLRLGNFAYGKTKLVLIAFIALFIFALHGISKIEINDNPVNWFKSDHQIRIADKVLNQHFAGTYDAWLVFDNKAHTTEQEIEQFIAIVERLALDDATQLEQYIANNRTSLQFFNNELLITIDDVQFNAPEDEQQDLAQLYRVAERAQYSTQIFLEPELLTWMADFQQQLVATGLVGKANGLVDIVRTVNRELHSGKAKDFTVPNSSEAVAQTLLQYQSSHRPQDLWHFVSQDFSRSLLWLQLTSGDNQHTTQVVEWVENYITQNPAPIDVELKWAGKSYLNIVWQNAMVSGMLDSLTSSFIVVFLMMVILFRSIKYGILAMLPLTFTISLIYGLIGWAGKAYDMPIAVLSALTLGLSIDFAIHFLQRTRELEKQLGNLRKALVAMFHEPSRAISRNAIVIAIGFTPLLLSPLMPYITVGFFLASIMITSALVTLVLLPALLTLFQSKASKQEVTI